jgi:multimeric flavodoxin WrbA
MLADASDLAAADAVIFGSPENFGYLSGGLKDFFDRTYYPLLPLQLGTPYAVFISAGNDGSGALRQLERIVKGYPLKPVAEPVIVKGVPDEQALAKAQELGAAIAAGTAMGIF